MFYQVIFLLATRDDSTAAVCQVKDFILPSSLKVVWWLESDAAPSISETFYQNVARSKVIELFS
jgi:hypothetical protein